MQLTARDLHMGQSVALLVSCDLVHSGTKCGRISRCFYIRSNTVYQFCNAFLFQRRTEKARKYTAAAYQPGDFFLWQITML